MSGSDNAENVSENTASVSSAAQQLAQAVAERLARHLTDVVICPGSRNAPLSLALLARDDIRVHTRIDERSAAFAALGMARVTHRHVGVVTTSGSAVANTWPAVVESRYSHTPLAIISADRPERLVGTGASQTIEQPGIFGAYATTTQVAAVGDEVDIDKRFAQDLTVHINVAFDAPLLGDGLPQQTGKRRRLPPVVTATQRAGVVDHGEVEVDLSRNTLVIAGDEAWEVDGLEDVPTIAEPTAPAPYHPVHPAAAHIFRKAQVSANDYVVNTKVEQVICVGHPTLHRDVMALVTDPDIDFVTLSRTADFTNFRGDSARRGTRVKVTGEPTKEWLRICEGVSSVGANAVREVLESADFGFTGLHVAAAVADTLALDDAFFVGASNPVRDAALVGLPFGGVDTYSPRGAAGIDGSVAQAVGVAMATQSLQPDAPRAPRTVALLGDVTFLHDVGGLLIGPDERHPENLTIVVANDNGGGIFETLEQGGEKFRAGFDKAFGTPHGVDIAALAEAYGHDYRRADSAQELLDTLAELKEMSPGITIVEARTSRDNLRALHAKLAEVVGK